MNKVEQIVLHRSRGENNVVVYHSKSITNKYKNVSDSTIKRLSSLSYRYITNVVMDSILMSIFIKRDQ